MNLKKGLVIGLFPLVGMVGAASADDYTDLVRMLEAKGVFTHEEAQKLIKLHEERMAKKKPAEGGETELSKEELGRLKRLVDLRIGGLSFIHYDYTANSPVNATKDRGEFVVTRAYLDIRKYFGGNENNYFRMTSDIYRNNNDPTGDGSYRFRLKYAFLNWQLAPGVQTAIGLTQRPWIDWEQNNVWKHRYVEKVFIEDRDGAHLINSADVGIALKGNYRGLGYMVGIYNGEGYGAAEKDHHFGKSLEGRIDYSFGEHLIGALHLAYIDHDTTDNTARDRAIIQPLLGFKNRYLLIAGQYIWDKEDPENGSAYTNTGYSINADIYLKPVLNTPITLFGRYGFWNFDSKAENKNDFRSVDRWQALLGVEYTWNSYIRSSVAYKYVNYDVNKTATETGKDNKQTLMVSMEVKW